MVRQLLLITVILTGFASTLTAAEPDRIPPNGPTGSELIIKIRKDLQWLAQVKTLHIDATAITRPSQEKIADSLQQLQRMYPDRLEFPPIEFSELLPEAQTVLQFDHDRQRFRSAIEFFRPDGSRMHRSLTLWNGVTAIQHLSSPGQEIEDQFSFRPSITITHSRPLASLNSTHQLIEFPWDSSEIKQQQAEQFGSPEDYILVDREDFHGIDCYVLLRLAEGNNSDRFYVGVQDGRWYGCKEGIVSLAHAPELSEAYARTVSQFLGRELNSSSTPREWAEAHAELSHLPSPSRAKWAKSVYQNVAKHYVPVNECWFEQYQAYGPDRFLPAQETLLTYLAQESEAPAVGTTRTLKIENLTIDLPLDDNLFKETPTVGARVTDWTHDPPLFYEHKEKFSPEEWKEILEKGKQYQQKLERNSRGGLKKYGKPVRELPQANWINSRPLRWEALRGKIVVLYFWSINVPESMQEIHTLQDPLKKDEALFESAENQGLKFPIMIFGVHAAGTPLKKIQEAVKEHNLKAPIVLDEKEGDLIGKLAETCNVTALPAYVAFDEEGNLIAVGSLNEVLNRVDNYARKPEK